MKTIVISYMMCAALPLCATTVVVGNSSFENDSPGFGNPTGWTLFDSTTSPTFSDDARTVANNGSVYPALTGVVGNQLVAVSLDHNFLGPSNPTPVVPANGSLAGLVSDNLGTFAANMVYTLSANIGLSQALTSLDVGLALGTGTPTLADVFPAPSNPNFSSVLINASQFTDAVLQNESITLNTSAHPGLVGQPIDISLIFQSEFRFGRQALFDDVNLSFAPSVPEPSTLMLFAISGVFLLVRHAAVGRASRRGL